VDEVQSATVLVCGWTMRSIYVCNFQ